MVVTWFSPSVKVNAVCPPDAVERIMQLIEFNGCTVGHIDYDAGRIGDISGSPARMSSLMKALEDLEWDGPEKIYIFIKAKKIGGKKHGKGVGKEADPGCEGGDREGTDSAPEHGEGPGVGGDGNPDRTSDPGDPAWVEEAIAAYGDSDQ